MTCKEIGIYWTSLKSEVGKVTLADIDQAKYNFFYHVQMFNKL